jgi:poly-gamma-glutamate capsule biosynthesis protein CapA/YwtB (metallophosphatase superfamily)
VSALSAARVSVCALANNHVLDWGYRGLDETLATLRTARIGFAGAGRDFAEASAPAIVPVSGGRISVWAMGHESSGVPPEWAAGRKRAGVWLIDDISARAAEAIAARVREHKQPGDLAVVSIHWGPNWGYTIPATAREFAHALVDGGLDVVHGHSSHHVKALEIYRGKLILYGCGDLVTDYEGIGGHKRFRGDLGLLYFPTFEGGQLVRLIMTPMRMRRFPLGCIQTCLGMRHVQGDKPSPRRRPLDNMARLSRRKPAPIILLEQRDA